MEKFFWASQPPRDESFHVIFSVQTLLDRESHAVFLHLWCLTTKSTLATTYRFSIYESACLFVTHSIKTAAISDQQGSHQTMERWRSAAILFFNLLKKGRRPWRQFMPESAEAKHVVSRGTPTGTPHVHSPSLGRRKTTESILVITL